MGVKRLRKIQLGLETTPGVLVPATAVLRGLEGTLEDEREQKFSVEDVGVLGGTDHNFEVKVGGKLDLSGEANFEQLPYFLAMAVKDAVTGVADGGGSGFVYSYPLPTTAKNDVKTYSFRAGDDYQAETMAFAFCPDLELSGSSGEEVKLSANLEGGEVVPGTFTGGLVLPSVETLLFQKARLFIDPLSGVIGTTQVSNALVGFSLKIKGGKVRRWTASGLLTHSHLGQDAPEVELSLTFEHEGSASALKTAWRSRATQLVRLEILGNALGTAGTYTTKLFRVDLVGKWTKFDKLEEQDGNDIVTGTFQARYNVTANTMGTFLVVNEKSALD
jgi:hypothetical protein